MRGWLIASLVALTVAAPASAAPYLSGVSGPRALAAVDLSGRWGFTPRGGDAATIAVPGGGWVKQGFAGVSEARYERRIAIPDVIPGQVTQLVLGAVNHEATLFVDGERVATNTTAFTPSTFDLTGHVRPGATHTVAIAVKGREAMLGDARPAVPAVPGVPAGAVGAGYTVPDAGSWSDGIPQGIFGPAPELRVLPPVHVVDAHVRPSVRERSLHADVWIANRSARPRTVAVGGRLRPVGGRRFRYPAIGRRTVRIEPGATAKVTLGPVAWKLGRRSYWWPNVPYRPGYRAVLHDLRVRVGGHGVRNHRARYRFGFRELRQSGTTYELNGMRVNFRGDSLTGAIYDRIDHGGKGDAFHTFPGFLPPSSGNGGWPQAVDNYQRLNMNVVRMHQEPASPYMLDVADARGLMIIGETAIRGSESKQDFSAGRENMLAHARQLVERDRNHASVVRWSQSNEPDANGRGEPPSFQLDLYRTITAADGTRPVSVDVTSNTYEDIDAGDFSVYQHYVNENGTIGGYTDDVHPREDRPFGRGEFIWPLSDRRAFTWFGTATQRMREKDAADIRPYALACVFGNVIPGVLRSSYACDNNLPPLHGEDSLPNPWSDPQVRRIQHGFHPVLVADTDYWERHKESDLLGGWPAATQPDLIAGGVAQTRRLVVFNDTFERTPIDVAWELRRGSATGEVLERGALQVAAAPGERAAREISFTPPAGAGRVHLVLTAARPGQGELFRETDQFFEVVP